MAVLNETMLSLLLDKYNETEEKGNELEKELLDFQDTKCYIETNIDVICPEEIGGDGVKTISERWGTTTIGDRTFVHIANDLKHTDGAFNHNLKKPTKEEFQLWVDLFNVEKVYSINELNELRGVANMTVEEYKVLIKEKANSYFDEISTLGFESDCLGEVKVFNSDTKSASLINGLVSIAQMNLINVLMGLEIDDEPLSWKESGVDVCYTWTNEQVIKLGKDLARATAELEHQRELTMVAINKCLTKEELDKIASAIK